MCIPNENHLRRDVLKNEDYIPEMDCKAGYPNNSFEPSNQYGLRATIDQLLDAVEQLSVNSSLSNIQTTLDNYNNHFKEFMKIICQMITRLHELSDQVALQDKVLSALLCNETARDDFKEYLNSRSTLDQLEKVELMDLINRISRYTPPIKTEEKVDK
ncbi:MAG: hypothetical protein V3U54_11670 [Thermodesulfobacteriota bacterium]